MYYWNTLLVSFHPNILAIWLYLSLLSIRLVFPLVLTWALIVSMKGLGINKIWWSEALDFWNAWSLRKLFLAFAWSSSLAAVVIPWSFLCLWVALVPCKKSLLNMFLWYLWLGQAQYTDLFQSINGFEHRVEFWSLWKWFHLSFCRC